MAQQLAHLLGQLHGPGIVKLWRAVPPARSDVEDRGEDGKGNVRDSVRDAAEALVKLVGWPEVLRQRFEEVD